MTVTIGRRELLAALGGAAVAWPLAASAQSPKMLRVGYSGMLPRAAPHYAAFEKRMAELGYQPGCNFTFEYIQAPSIEGYEVTYRELAARKVDVLLAAGNEPALRAAAGTTPTVFIALDFDPVEKGYVASLSRPGNNSTGLFVSQLALAGKRVEFLRKTFPNARRIGILWDATSRAATMPQTRAASSSQAKNAGSSAASNASSRGAPPSRR
jgi:putative ABC transport system substrate-binding protein